MAVFLRADRMKLKTQKDKKHIKQAMADNKKDNVSEAKKENTTYNPQEVESRWYQYWTDKGLFHSEPDGREPFTVVIPPPNVTGVLHMGHGTPAGCPARITPPSPPKPKLSNGSKNKVSINRT